MILDYFYIFAPKSLKTNQMCTSGGMQGKTEWKRMNSFVFLFSAIILLSVISSSTVLAQGNLLITPRRVVFEGNKRTQDLNLANTGVDSAKYNVSIVQYKMMEDGSFKEITEPEEGQRFADPFLRFFPRTVTLAPNEAQVVKMQLIKTNQLQPGEYRSHVYFRAVPKETALGSQEINQDTTSIGVKLTPIFGITIPVIIHVGESDTKVNLTDLKMETVSDTIPRLQFAFNRTGNMSVYGDIKVEHVSPLSVVTPVGIVRGVAVYTPNAIRRFQMDLDRKAKVDYRSGRLKVTYSTQSDAKSEVLAVGELSLN